MNNSGISNVSVTIYNANGESKIVTTDTSGNYSISNYFYKGLDYAVRPSVVSGYSKAIATNSSAWNNCENNGAGGYQPTHPTYECQPSEGSKLGCGSECNFVFDPNTFPSKTSYTICSSGTAGQNGCDAIGGEGIQQAIDAAPVGDASNLTTITIKPGTYTRTGYTQYTNTAGGLRKAFVYTKGKYIRLKGEGTVTLDGAASIHALSGVAADAGELTVENLRISGMKRDPETCFSSTSVCGDGIGIYVFKNTKVTITNSTVSGNTYTGILLTDTAQGTITNSTVSGNTYVGILLGDTAQGTIQNNVIYGNKYQGIDCGYTSKCSVVNNISMNNGGVGIIAAQKSNFVRLAYNLSFGNQSGSYNDFWTTSELTQSGNLSLDPKFVNATGGDFHLQSGSPAINTGDPLICDSGDKSRSDMGVFGGTETCTNTHTKPDIIFSGLEVRPPAPTVNDTVQITIKVKNISQVAINNAAVVRLYVDPTVVGPLEIDGIPYTQQFVTDPLGEGIEQKFNYTYQPNTLSVGKHQVYVFVDANYDIDESNEDNYFGPGEFTVVDNNQTEPQACIAAGGTWEEFSNGCADKCNSGPYCTQVITQGCNCPGTACWDGTKCVGANSCSENGDACKIDGDCCSSYCSLGKCANNPNSSSACNLNSTQSACTGDSACMWHESFGGTHPACKFAGDYDNSEKVDLDDIMYILEHYNGSQSEFTLPTDAILIVLENYEF